LVPQADLSGCQPDEAAARSRSTLPILPRTATIA